MRTLKKWIQIETESCIQPEKAAKHEGHDAEVFRARSQDFDLRRAEALCLTSPTDFLEDIRTRMARGQMEQAQSMLDTAHRLNLSLAQDPEWLLESSRIKTFFHQWDDAITDLTHLLKLEPTPGTRVTALQARSIAAYECGRFSQALADVDLIRSLGHLYPFARAVFYSQILSIKIKALSHPSPEVVRDMARLWEQSLAGAPTIDTLLTLLRLEAHVLRCLGRDPASALVASITLAEHMGDDLYAALGRFELGANGANGDEWRHRRLTDHELYPKIRLLQEDLVADESLTTTVQSLRQFPRRASEFKIPSPSARFSSLIVPSRSLIVRLDPFELQRFSAWTRPLEALTLIARHGSMTKEALFHRLFGGQKYVQHLHGGVIHQLLSRARKQTGLNLRIREAQIQLDDSLWVETT